jgi:hypothetical protein
VLCDGNLDQICGNLESILHKLLAVYSVVIQLALMDKAIAYVAI